MTDKHEDLIKRLHTYFANTGLTIGQEASDAIEELVADLAAARADKGDE